MVHNIKIIQVINRTISVRDILERERMEVCPLGIFSTSCVAHEDLKPSLRVYEEGEHSYCFSCGKSYTPYLIIKHLTGLRFPEIVDRCIDIYGFKIPPDLETDEESHSLDKLIAAKISLMKDFASPKLLHLVNVAVSADSKEGSATNTKTLCSKVQALSKSKLKRPLK